VSDGQITPETLAALHKKMFENPDIGHVSEWISPREYTKRRDRYRHDGTPMWVPSYMPWPLPEIDPPLAGGAPASTKDENDGEETQADPQ
jgi:GT2 family glycosyltransferase